MPPVLSTASRIFAALLLLFATLVAEDGAARADDADSPRRPPTRSPDSTSPPLTVEPAIPDMPEFYEPPPAPPPPTVPVIVAPKGEGVPPDVSEAPIDYETRRYEPAGFPLIGGNSDIGFEFGAVGTLTLFDGGVRPYVWNLDLVLAASLKDGPHGNVELAQQNYFTQLDVPKLYGGSIRITPGIGYQQTVDAEYYGRGNNTAGTRPAMINGEPGRFFEYLSRESRFRDLNRITISKPYDLAISVLVRYEAPESYPGSRLALDAASFDEHGNPLARGLRRAVVAGVGTGLIIDSRDNEFFARRGVFHQIGARYMQGFPFDGDIKYVDMGAIFAGYVPVAGPLVFAARAQIDFQVGDVPFYDLFMGGPFNPNEIPGGANGIRGVPIGRYAGLIKAVGTVEARAMLARFKLVGQSFRFGGDTFFDGGRAFDDYSFSSPRDGKGVGLKWGTGVGGYLQWGEAAIFRVDVAYSPDAYVESPNFPLGIYVQDGTNF